MKYKCTVCGYIYDPEIGDQENGIAKGTIFEEIEESWACPLCEADKSFFEPLE